MIEDQLRKHRADTLVQDHLMSPGLKLMPSAPSRSNETAVPPSGIIRRVAGEKIDTGVRTLNPASYAKFCRTSKKKSDRLARPQYDLVKIYHRVVIAPEGQSGADFNLGGGG